MKRSSSIFKLWLIDICITPNRMVNRLEIFVQTTIESAIMNTIQLLDYYLKNQKHSKLVTQYISNNKYTDLELRIPNEAILELTLYEASNDLLTNEKFSVPARPDTNIPMPFVLNDAVLTTKTIRFE